MNTFRTSGPIRNAPWLLGTFALVVLTGCATGRPAEADRGSDADMVNIGYGEAEKDHIVGSVSKVNAEDVPQSQTRTLAEMLGRIPGVQVSELPGGRLSVRIRGTSSFLAGKEPLWVVDGMALQSGGTQLATLNPNNVESITVLKDAGATAIYGSRGANGVILIKTKR
jgi:TonB-dependent SusC/RagA subfamily outer membrane receptor